MFAQTDPIDLLPERLVDPQQLNPYLYTRGNPLRYTDTSGKVLQEKTTAVAKFDGVGSAVATAGVASGGNPLAMVGAAVGRVVANVALDAVADKMADAVSNLFERSASTTDLLASEKSAIRGIVLGRPSPSDSEAFVTSELAPMGFESQVSFLNGVEVNWGTANSVRPDNYGGAFSMSVDVKNYTIEDNSDVSRLVANIASQFVDRQNHLPEGTLQGIVVDIRGQSVTEAQKKDIINGILQQTGGGIRGNDIVFLEE